MLMQRSNSVINIRNVFRNSEKPLTLVDIKKALPELKASTISMVLCYLLKQRYVIREKISNPKEKHVRLVWIYTYNEQRYTENRDAN